jgi:hypothetical protein
MAAMEQSCHLSSRLLSKIENLIVTCFIIGKKRILGANFVNLLDDDKLFIKTERVFFFFTPNELYEIMNTKHVEKFSCCCHLEGKLGRSKSSKALRNVDEQIG